ncbi:efflux RND transporter periplasmic adaptor subunit [Methylocaldum sp. 14B]|jgi:cobalt-zinc-cadmium efflux system membrane fusion protein|uniref:efflux RND transporter periplasmic adaptor subunit n=1 Tax=unclassified Methylocaldum TaxID=2622260 RepID=UPI00098B8DB5|nr:efflux RND transporter periplasmic adaptor subunit [Methylocaldum sp. 14B]
MKILIPLVLCLIGLAPAYGQDAAGAVTVTAPSSLLQRLTIAPVAPKETAESLHLPARVALDEHRVARIGPSVSGRVAEINAFIGQTVKKGEILARINSTELGNAQAAYLKAKTRVNLYKLAVDRARRLLQADVISRAELKERESELMEAEVELRASADQLRVMGMSEGAIQRLAATGQIDSVTPVTATVAGTVIERHVSLGQIAQTTDDLFTIADLSRVWVVAEAPEQKAYLIEPDGQTEVQIPALPGQKISGKLIYVSDIVNPTTRTVTVRMEVNNAERKIKPEMLATMVIRKPALTGLGVPAKAVVRSGDQDYVFVRIAADGFALRPVSLAPEQGGYRRVIEGLTEGEPTVVDGAFHLNNERIRKELE